MGTGATETRLLFHHLPPTWVLGLVILPGILALAWFAYRRPRRRPPRQRLLTALRSVLLALTVFLLLGPYLRQSRIREEPAPLALLLDDSASLQRRDSLDADAHERLAAAGLSLPGTGDPSRLELARTLLASPWRATLEERYQLQAYRFAGRLAPTAADGGGLAGRGAATALGDALAGVLAEFRGRRLPDLVLVSDGRSTAGQEPVEAARRLAAEGVTVHVVALGDPRPAPDLALERIRVPELVLEGDEALFLLRLRASGTGIPAAVTVRLLDESGRTLQEQRVEPAAGEERQFTLVARLDRAGQRLLRAEVPPLPEETSRQDNVLELPVEVRQVRIRILYVDGRPRWEYRYLKNRLVRAERDLETRVWLADANRDFPQEATRGLPRLTRIPTTVEELLENFDVVILGDIEPRDLDPDPLAGPAFVEAVAEFVRRGGGLLVLAGPEHSAEVWRGSPLEPLLPVILGREEPARVLPFRPEPADAALPHPVTLLDPDPARSLRLWRELEPLWWYQPVERLRPGAQAWLVHPQASNRHGPHIVAAGGFAPEGWVGWIGTDETWRWRWPAGERLVGRFWRSVIRHLATARLRAGSGRARLDLGRSRIELGESVLVEARLRDEAWQPLVREEPLPAFVEGRPEPVLLAPVPEEPGVYRGRLRPARPGSLLLYLAENEEADGETLATARLEVVLPSRETRDTSQDAATLARIAALTGGQVVPVDRAGELLEVLDGRERARRTLATRELPLAGLPILFLFLFLAAGEWLLRKWTDLS